MTRVTKGEAEIPDWEAGGKTNNWRNYIGDELRELWPFFAPEHRVAIAENAQNLADREDWE